MCKYLFLSINRYTNTPQKRIHHPTAKNINLKNYTREQILESREKKWILIGLLRSVPEKSSLNLTLYMGIALANGVYLLIPPNFKTPKM